MEAVIGIVGLVLGVFLTETFRYIRRSDEFSKLLFDKKLDRYSSLYDLIVKSHNLINEMIDDEELTQEERHQFESTVVWEIVEFTESNEFYLSELVLVEAMTVFMGAEDFPEMNEEDALEARKNLNHNVKNLKDMIRSEAGITRIEKDFRKITKAKLDSPIIKYMNRLKRELNKNN